MKPAAINTKATPNPSASTKLDDRETFQGEAFRLLHVGIAQVEAERELYLQLRSLVNTKLRSIRRPAAHLRSKGEVIIAMLMRLVTTEAKKEWEAPIVEGNQVNEEQTNEDKTGESSSVSKVDSVKDEAEEAASKIALNDLLAAMIHLYFVVGPQLRDWTVASAASDASVLLSMPMSNKEQDENLIEKLKQKPVIAALLKKATKDCHGSATSFRAFCAIWDRAGHVVLKAVVKAPIPLLEECKNMRSNLLILTWEISCLVRLEFPDEPFILGPVTAFAFVLIIIQAQHEKNCRDEKLIKKQPSDISVNLDLSYMKLLSVLLMTLKEKPKQRQSSLNLVTAISDDTLVSSSKPIRVQRALAHLGALFGERLQGLNCDKTLLEVHPRLPQLVRDLHPTDSKKQLFSFMKYYLQTKNDPSFALLGTPSHAAASTATAPNRTLPAHTASIPTYYPPYATAKVPQPVLMQQPRPPPAMMARPGRPANNLRPIAPGPPPATSGQQQKPLSLPRRVEESNPPSAKRQKTTPVTPSPKKQLLNALKMNNLAAAMDLCVTEAKKLPMWQARGDSDSEAVTIFPSDRRATPAAVTDTMELTEWIVSLLSLDHVQPSRKLRTFLDAASEKEKCPWSQVVFPILNKTLQRLLESTNCRVEKPSRTAAISVDNSTGVVRMLLASGGTVSPDQHLGQAVVALYYHALEAVLYVESSRLQQQSHPQIALNPIFHQGLLACTCWCVTKAVGATQKVRASPSLQALSMLTILRDVTESNPYDFLKVCDSFLRSLSSETIRSLQAFTLGSPLPVALPKLMQYDLEQTQSNLLDSLVWSITTTPTSANLEVSSLPRHIEEFQEKSEAENNEATFWPPEILAPTLREEVLDLSGKSEDEQVPYPRSDHEDYAEYRCVSLMIRKLVMMVFFRLEGLCRCLGVPPSLATQAWVAFRYLVRHHIDLLFDRHVDQWAMCCLYGVGRVMSDDDDFITFGRLIEAYIVLRGPELGDITCHNIIRHVKIENDRKDAANINSVIVLYNKVFVPTMKDYLMESASLKKAKEDLPGLLEALDAENPVESQ